MKSSERYRRMVKDVEEFRDAYKAVLSHMQPTREAMGGYIIGLEPKRGSEQEAANASAKASRLAGRAKYAQERSGIPSVFTVPAIGMPVDAITSWDHSLRDAGHLPPKQLINLYDTIIGALEEKVSRAEATEGTLAGRVAHFVGFPARVRGIVMEEHPGLGKAAFATGVVAQIFVGVMVGVLTAAALAGVATMWKYATADPRSSKPRPAITTPAPALSTVPTPSTPMPSHT